MSQSTYKTISQQPAETLYCCTQWWCFTVDFPSLWRPPRQLFSKTQPTEKSMADPQVGTGDTSEWLPQASLPPHFAPCIVDQCMPFLPSWRVSEQWRFSVHRKIPINPWANCTCCYPRKRRRPGWWKEMVMSIGDKEDEMWRCCTLKSMNKKKTT